MIICYRYCNDANRGILHTIWNHYRCLYKNSNNIQLQSLIMSNKIPVPDSDYIILNSFFIFQGKTRQLYQSKLVNPANKTIQWGDDADIQRASLFELFQSIRLCIFLFELMFFLLFSFVFLHFSPTSTMWRKSSIL